MEDIFSKLNRATYFTTLVLQTCYHHIPLDKPSIPKTAFNSPFRKYEYIKGPFGLAQAPAYFQELMTGILKDFNFTIAYLNDIIIFSKTLQEHLSHIRKVFEKLKSAKLSMKKRKRQLLFERNQVLGTHFKCYRYQTPTIQDTCHKIHATTNHTQTSSSFSWISQILQEAHKRICQNCQATNIAHTTTG